MKSRRILPLGMAFGFVLSLLAGTPAPAASPGQSGKLAYVVYPAGCAPSCGGLADIFTATHEGLMPTNVTNSPGDDVNPAWSPDGARIAFSSDRDGNYEIYVMNADGSGQTRLTNNAAADLEPTWGLSGTQIAFTSSRDGNDEIYAMTSAGTGQTRITNNAARDHEPDWSPTGQRIAFTSNRSRPGSSDVFTMNPDGTDVSEVPLPTAPGECWITGPDHSAPDWSPSGHKLTLASFGDEECLAEEQVGRIETVRPDGSDRTFLVDDIFVVTNPVWSPDGNRVAYVYSDTPEIRTVDSSTPSTPQTVTNGEDPDWQPLPINSYPRPKGATPVRASLVRAFAPCSTPSKTHGPPLAFPSCGAPPQSPPAPHPAISPNVNVGTADTNNARADFVGFVRMDIVPGNPATPADEADVSVSVRATDLRCFFASSVPACGPQNAADGDDYTGELQGALNVRITDKDNTPNPDGPGAGTVQDSAIEFAITCTATSATFTGGLCNLTSSIDALVPGSAVEGRRAIWQLGQVQVFDGGPDADADTPGNSLFATQGVWIP